MPAHQMALAWKRHGDSWRGFDAGRFLIASVVRYDAPVPHWSASVRLERVEGRHETAEQAMAAAEQAHHATWWPGTGPRVPGGRHAGA